VCLTFFDNVIILFKTLKFGVCNNFYRFSKVNIVIFTKRHIDTYNFETNAFLWRYLTTK